MERVPRGTPFVRLNTSEECAVQIKGPSLIARDSERATIESDHHTFVFTHLAAEVLVQYKTPGRLHGRTNRTVAPIRQDLLGFFGVR